MVLPLTNDAICRLQFLIDRLGRKTMLLTGSTIMFVTMVSVGVIVAKFRHDWASHANAGKQTLRNKDYAGRVARD